MRVSGNLAKFAITWPFGHFWSRFLRQNLLQSFHVKCMLIRVYCNFRQSAIGPFKRGQLFRRFLKNLPCSPLFTFSENAGVWCPCDNCNNLPIRTLLEPLFAQNLLPSSSLFSSSFALFQKMRVLGDVAKIAITWSFRTFWSCFLRQTLLQSLHY